MSDAATQVEDLTQRTCKPCEGGIAPLTDEQAGDLLQKTPGWEVAEGRVTRAFEFKDHYQAMGFVNAVAWISHAENHHPDMEVGYNTCRVSYWTHAVGGLTENDFICAAKVSALLD